MRPPNPALGPEAANAAFVRLYEDHYNHVFGYCLRRTSRGNAEDAAAEVFVIAWRKLAEVPAGEQTLSWLYGVAYRVLSHQWRSTRRFGNLVDRIGSLSEETASDPAEQVVRRAEDCRVLAAASRLKKADREILRLAGWEQLPHDEIAIVLGVSIDAVAQRFRRAKKRLAREYGNKSGVRPPTVQKGEEQ